MSLTFKTYRFKNKIMSRISPSRAARKVLTQFIRPRRLKVKPWEDHAERQGQRIFINDNVSAIRWLPTVGDGENSLDFKKILLVHGWESRATQMYALVPALLTLGYQVIAIDMPGHGKSAGEVSHAEIFINTLLLTQQKLGVFDAVVGHSLGAGASGIALSRGLTTDKIVLISGPSSIENALTRFTGTVGLNTIATEHFIEFAGQLVGKRASELDAVNTPRAIQVAMLIIHDQSDIEVPLSESERLLSRFKDAELYITQGLGHRRILKSKEVIEKVCEFLRD